MRPAFTGYISNRELLTIRLVDLGPVPTIFKITRKYNTSIISYITF
jgi:hypothetical protein